MNPLSLQVLSKELEQSLVAALILLLDSIIRQVRAGAHPAVNLVIEALDVLRSRQRRLELLDVLLRLITRSQQDHRDRDALCVLGVDHGGVNRSQHAEGVRELVRHKRDDLAAPAELSVFVSITSQSNLVRGSTYTEDSKAVDLGRRRLDRIRIQRERVRNALGRVIAEKRRQVALLGVVGRRVPVNLGRVALEPVGHVDAVLVLVVAVGEEIGALDSLVEVAKDVVDDNDGVLGVLRARDVRLVVANGLVVALGLVSLADNGREVAAGGAVARGGFHGRPVMRGLAGECAIGAVGWTYIMMGLF